MIVIFLKSGDRQDNPNAKAPKVKEAKPSENVVPTVLSSESDMSIDTSETSRESTDNSVRQRLGDFEKYLD